MCFKPSGFYNKYLISDICNTRYYILTVVFSGNLGSHKSLHTLDMSHNDLISTKGIGECVTLQVLDLSHNHLTSIDEVGKLCLLRHLVAFNNNIMEVLMW